MIVLACPTGCAIRVRQPFKLRGAAIRCANCTAWFAAPTRIEDGTFVEGDLLARPGESLPSPTTPITPPMPAWLWLALAVACLLAVGILVTLVAHR